MSTVVDVGALGSSGFVVRGAAAGDEAGFSVSAVGDFNGDGFDDFLIGAPLNDSGGSDSGAAYLLYGHAGGFGTMDLANLQPSQGFRIQGDSSSDHAGLSVAGGGDINGDGFTDLLVGATAHGLLGYGFNLEAFVIFGRAAKPAGIDLTGLSTANGFSVTSDIGTGYTGTVASAGDINGDGFDDFILGSPFDGPHSASQFGSAYVVFGKAGGFGPLDATNLGSNGFSISESSGLFHVGFGVSGAGDVNGDGFDDLVVSAAQLGFYHYGSFSTAYVIFGKQTGFGAVDLSALPASDGFAIRGAYSYGGDPFIVAAGDVNGDGFDDVVLGSLGQGPAGTAYVVFGKSTGLDSVDLLALAPSAGFVIHGAANDDWTGFAVAAAGDVNADGFSDIIVGAPLADGGGINAGGAYVIYGKAGGFGTIELANLAASDGFFIQGDAKDDRAGSSVSSAGDLNGDGADDLIIGAPFGDASGVDAGQAYVIFGAAPAHRDAQSDFNGDGRSDLMWRDASGRMSEWLAGPNGGFHWNPDSGFAVGNDWSMKGFGDFDGDGRDDILWRQDGTGIVMEWLSSNTNFAFNMNLALPTSYQFVGIGDFNGDHYDDVMWRNSDGTLSEWLGKAFGGFQWNASAAFQVSNDWHVVGTGDVNGDGRDDLIWRQDGSGTVMEWRANAQGGFAWTGNYAQSSATQLVAVGDFNGDMRDDLLWRDASGALSEWLAQAGGGYQWNPYGAFDVANSWTIAATGDFDRDGREDIVWKTDSGHTYEWLGQANGGFVWNPYVQYDVGTSFHAQPPPIL